MNLPKSTPRYIFFFHLAPLIASFLSVSLDLRHTTLTLLVIYFAGYMSYGHWFLITLIVSGLIEDIMFQNLLGLSSMLFIGLLLGCKSTLPRVSVTNSFTVLWVHYLVTMCAGLGAKLILTFPQHMMLHETIALFMMGSAFPVLYRYINNR